MKRNGDLAGLDVLELDDLHDLAVISKVLPLRKSPAVIVAIV